MIYIYFIFSIIIFVPNSQAQIIRGYGLKVGTTISNQDWEYFNSPGLRYPSIHSDNRTGLNIGIFSEFLNLPHISILTELNYIQKGMKKDIPVRTVTQPEGTGELINWDIRVDYINLSAFGKLKFNVGSFAPYVLLGPKIDFEISKIISLGWENNVENDFNKNRFGFKAGIGTELNLFAFSLLAEFVFDADFNELYENQNLKIKSNSFDLRIGIIL